MNTLFREAAPLSAYLNMIRKRLWLVALCCAAFAALSLAYWFITPTTYAATARIAVGDTAATEVLDQRYKSVSDRLRDMENEINFAQSDEVRDLVEDRFGQIPSVVIGSESGSDTLVVTAVAESPDQAAEWANGWAESFTAAKRAEVLRTIEAATGQLQNRLTELSEERTRLRQPLGDLENRAAVASGDRLERLALEIASVQSELQPELDLIDAEIGLIASSVTDLRVTAEVSGVSFSDLFQRAAPPQSPENQPLSVLLPLGLIVGLLIGLSAAVLLDALDPTMSNADEVGAAVGLPVLAVVPRTSRTMSEDEIALSTLTDRHHPVSSAYHQLRAAVAFSQSNKNIRSILVTSADASEGKSTTSLNLAGAMASAGTETVLLDADYRRPRIQKFLDVPLAPGASDLIFSDEPLSGLGHSVPEGKGCLVAFTAGSLPTSPADFVASRSYRQLVEDLEVRSQLLVIDGAPVLPVADSVSLSSAVDAVILAVRARRTRKDRLRSAIDRIENAGGTVLGIVLVGAKDRDGAYSSTYEYSVKEREAVGISDADSLFTEKAAADVVVGKRIEPSERAATRVRHSIDDKAKDDEIHISQAG